MVVKGANVCIFENEITQKLNIFYLNDVDSIRFSTFENIHLTTYKNWIDEKYLKFKKFPSPGLGTS